MFGQVRIVTGIPIDITMGLRGDSGGDERSVLTQNCTGTWCPMPTPS
jgi:hypothetical protein